jgi:hypothetical protein
MDYFAVLGISIGLYVLIGQTDHHLSHARSSLTFSLWVSILGRGMKSIYYSQVYINF